MKPSTVVSAKLLNLPLDRRCWPTENLQLEGVESVVGSSLIKGVCFGLVLTLMGVNAESCCWELSDEYLYQ